MLPDMNFVKKIIFVQVILIFTNCVTAPPKWTQLPYKRSRIEGVGQVAVDKETTLNEAIIKARVMARTELAKAFRTDVQTQISISGGRITQNMDEWTNIILYNSKIAKEKTSNIEGSRIRFAYAYISKGTNSPYTASFLSLLFPGLGQKYNEDFSFWNIFLGSSFLSGIVISHMQYDRAFKNHRKASPRDKGIYRDEYRFYYTIRTVFIGLYSVLTLYSSIDAYRDAKAEQDTKSIFDAVYRNNRVQLYFSDHNRAIGLAIKFHF